MCVPIYPTQRQGGPNGSVTAQKTQLKVSRYLFPPKVHSLRTTRQRACDPIGFPTAPYSLNNFPIFSHTGKDNVESFL